MACSNPICVCLRPKQVDPLRSSGIHLKRGIDIMKITSAWAVFSILFIATAGQAQDLILSGPLSSGWHYINGSIATRGATALGSGVDLDLIAQNTIRFNPGFKVMPGASLKAAASPDTDGDFILDRVEKISGCQNYRLTDTDGDDLSDSLEDANRNGIHELGLNETSACSDDTDGDKIDDKWERDHGLDPLTDDADQDPDGDGLSNYVEYYFHVSDPLDGSSLPPKGAYYEYDELGRVKKIIRIK